MSSKLGVAMYQKPSPIPRDPPVGIIGVLAPIRLSVGDTPTASAGCDDLRMFAGE
jgi:hypothetical protein